MHDGLDVVSREESGDAVADAFEPAVVVLLDNVNDGSFHEGQLILFVFAVVVDGHNYQNDKNSSSAKVNPPPPPTLPKQGCFSTYLSLNRPSGPTGDLRRHKGHCNGQPQPRLLHSRQAEEEAGARAHQTHPFPPVEAEEVEPGCRLLKVNKIRG